MAHLTTELKLQKIFEKEILSRLPHWLEKLNSGDLSGVERDLFAAIAEVAHGCMEGLLQQSADLLLKSLKAEAEAQGGRQIVKRSLRIQLQNGRKVSVYSPYVKRPGQGYEGSRHLLSRHWKLIGSATLGLYDRVGYFAALCPSYCVAQQALSKVWTELSLSKVQSLTDRLAEHCFQLGEENLSLEAGESLAGHRVVLSLDGGRTRTRQYNGKLSDQNQPCFDTPWCEPKLFVITTLDKKGKLKRKTLPIYGARFAETDTLGLLKKYLLKLDIDQAEVVQIIADGAPWIWQRLKPILLEIGLAEDRIIETLDYYHASEYLHQLVEHMPKRISSKKKDSYLQQFKQWLWQGQSSKILSCCREVFKRPSQLVKRWMAYLEKHQHRTHYAEYQDNKLFCGSGIIESGIRRIINLRFKNSSTFWLKEKVEKLYFFRAALLSGRWEILYQNLANATP